MLLSCIISEIKRDIRRKSRCFHTPTPPLGGPRPNTAIRFGTEKLEWCGYRCWRSLRDVYSFWHNTGTWRTQDRQTDGHHAHDGTDALMQVSPHYAAKQYTSYTRLVTVCYLQCLLFLVPSQRSRFACELICIGRVRNLFVCMYVWFFYLAAGLFSPLNGLQLLKLEIVLTIFKFYT